MRSLTNIPILFPHDAPNLFTDQRLIDDGDDIGMHWG